MGDHVLKNYGENAGQKYWTFFKRTSMVTHRNRRKKLPGSNPCAPLFLHIAFQPDIPDIYSPIEEITDRVVF
jgi:hypothetical protein